MRKKRSNNRKLTSKKLTGKKLTKKRKQKGGRPTEDKLSNIIQNVFSSNHIKYLPTTGIFINDLQNKYVHMVDLNELRNIIDNDKYLKTSNIISNIYKNKEIINLSDIYGNIDLTILDSSLSENIKILFQHIIDYNMDRYVKLDVDIYSVITKLFLKSSETSVYNDVERE